MSKTFPTSFAPERILQKPEVDNWKELEGKMLNTLLDSSLPSQDGIATQLSDILPCCRASRSRIVSVAEARRVTQAVYEGDLSPLKESQSRGITFWALQNLRALGCLLSAYQSYADNTGHSSHGALTRMRYAGKIQDLYSHTLTGTKWIQIIRKVAFVVHPVGMIRNHRAARPHHATKRCF